MSYNDRIQNYKGIPLKLIVYTESRFQHLKAKCFHILNATNQPSGQQIWIPNRFLSEDGTINPTCNIDWLFRKEDNATKLRSAGFILNER